MKMEWIKKFKNKFKNPNVSASFTNLSEVQQSETESISMSNNLGTSTIEMIGRAITFNKNLVGICIPIENHYVFILARRETISIIDNTLHIACDVRLVAPSTNASFTTRCTNAKASGQLMPLSEFPLSINAKDNIKVNERIQNTLTQVILLKPSSTNSKTKTVYDLITHVQMDLAQLLNQSYCNDILETISDLFYCGSIHDTILEHEIVNGLYKFTGTKKKTLSSFYGTNRQAFSCDSNDNMSDNTSHIIEVPLCFGTFSKYEPYIVKVDNTTFTFDLAKYVEQNAPEITINVRGGCRKQKVSHSRLVC